MKKLLNFSLAIIAVAFVACSYEDVALSTNESPSNPYEVTPDEAVQLLQTVMGGESTRAVSVGSIQTLKKSDFVPTTRGAEDGDVVYIVDMEDGGSAIMGADKRMEPIYAILDETKISPEQLTLTATRSDDGEQDIEEYVMGLVNKKIEADVSALAFPEMPIVPRPHEVTVTVPLGAKSPLLRTKWHQLSPFNDLYPNNLPAGCAPVALAQITYHLRSRDSYSVYDFDWDVMSGCEYLGDFSDAACLEVAELTYSIAGCVCQHLRDPESPNSNANFDLVRNGFASFIGTCSYQNYDFSGIKSLLNNNKPVYISGAHVYDSMPDNPEGHAWVIDGYNSYIEKIYEREYNGLDPSLYTDTLISSTTYNLVHCNYGWGGLCDGYYTSGVFDVSEPLDDDMIDDSVGDCEGTNGDYIFNRSLKYILY